MNMNSLTPLAQLAHYNSSLWALFTAKQVETSLSGRACFSPVQPALVRSRCRKPVSNDAKRPYV
jgi:hypothetical protein